MYSIFIQVASYRDPELVPTLNSLLTNAKYKDNLTVCVAHQNSKEDKWDNLDKFKTDPRFIIIDIPHNESLGTCWARYQIQRHFAGQHFTLQIDSHHRFVKDWDEICIEMFLDLRKKGHKRPLITSYLPSYVPNTKGESKVKKPWLMGFDRFTPNGMVFFRPQYMDKKIKEPVPARFYSGHFAFTIGEFCREVPHDPNLYFHGEEISIAARAFTWGYDLFHPHKVIAWHEYTREGRAKHWDDDVEWSKRDQNAQSRVKTLLKIDNQQCTSCARKALKGYDFGPERALSAYEDYAGIDFKNRTVQKACIDNELPKHRDEEYFSLFKYTITVPSNLFSHDNYMFVSVIYEDKNGNQVYRNDLTDKEVAVWPHKKEIIIETEYTGPTPYKYIIWPHTNNKEWVDRYECLVV